MEKYIFLDFDGVMTSGKNYDALVSAGKPVCDEHGDLFDPEAVTNLQMIPDGKEQQIQRRRAQVLGHQM